MQKHSGVFTAPKSRLLNGLQDSSNPALTSSSPTSQHTVKIPVPIQVISVSYTDYTVPLGSGVSLLVAPISFIYISLFMVFSFLLVLNEPLGARN